MKLTSSSIACNQVYFRMVRDEILHANGLPGGGIDLGDPQDLFRGMTAHHSVDDVDNVESVVASMHAIGTAYWYRSSCPSHAGRSIGPRDVAKYFDGSVWAIPCGKEPHSVQDSVDRVTSEQEDEEYQQRNCPFCLDGLQIATYPWVRALPSEEEAPQRLMLAIEPPSADFFCVPSVPRTLLVRVPYNLVGIVYSKPSHFVSQFLVGSRWVSYDCCKRGETTLSPTFGTEHTRGRPYLLAYRRS